MTEPVHVEVEVPAVETQEPNSSAPSVTVVETESGGVDGDVARLLAEHAAEIATLRAEIDAANERAIAAEAAAANAQAIGDIALEVADEAVGEVAELIADAEPESDPDADVEPKREHWFFRDYRPRS